MYLTKFCSQCNNWQDDDGTNICFGCLSHFGCEYIDNYKTEETIINKKELYIFSGSVFYFDTYIKDVKNIKTFAISEKQALNNLTFKIKKELGYSNNSKIILKGVIKKGYE